MDFLYLFTCYNSQIVARRKQPDVKKKNFWWTFIPMIFVLASELYLSILHRECYHPICGHQDRSLYLASLLCTQDKYHANMLLRERSVKTQNCLRPRVLTWSMCPHLAYVSSPRIDPHVFQSWALQAPPLLGCVHKKSRAYHSVFKSLKAWKVNVVWTDATMLPYKVILIRSTPEIVAI